MGTSPTKTSARGESKSPKTVTKPEPSRKDNNIIINNNNNNNNDSKAQESKSDSASNPDASRPLAPPPKPGTGADYFTSKPPGSLSLEPNPFEQSFAPGPETPGGTKLPSVAALTSPSALLPGTGNTPFNWPGSLRTGPLSPAMLSGPATQDYFSDTHHFKGGFPTPNESSLRTGLTPGGSGTMFPAPSPGTTALFASLNAAGGATPSTLEFQRTALSAAAKREHQIPPPPVSLPIPNPTSQVEAPAVQPMIKSEGKGAAAPYDPHDNDAANGLYMLAQGRNGTQPQQSFPPIAEASQSRVALPPQPASSVASAITTSPQMAPMAITNGVRGISEANSAGSDDSEQALPASRNTKKRNSQSSVTNGRRKAEEPLPKAPQAKKAKTSSVVSINGLSDEHSDDEDMKFKSEDGGSKSKMTEEEKRKNFLERNRVAALKCRQRKKQWLQNLQTKVEVYSSENDMLSSQIQQLREEVVNLKTLLLAHKDCPVTQQQSMAGGAPFIPATGPEPYATGPPMPYGMGAPMPTQAVMAGQPGNRRYS